METENQKKIVIVVSNEKQKGGQSNLNTKHFYGNVVMGILLSSVEAA